MSGKTESGLRLLSIGTNFDQFTVSANAVLFLLSRWRGNSGVIAASYAEGNLEPNKAKKQSPGALAPMRYL